MIKKIFSWSSLLKASIFMSVLLVAFFVFQDIGMTPKERLQEGVLAYSNKNYKKAELYFRDVASSGDPRESALASFYLGYIYLTGCPSVPKNVQKAELFLEQAAILGNLEAQYKLALLYDTGTQIPENRPKAIALMNRAAQNGYTDAVYGLGVWLERGYLGEVALEKVILLYEKAALEGHPSAMASLAAIYAGSIDASLANAQKARFWLNELHKRKS